MLDTRRTHGCRRGLLLNSAFILYIFHTCSGSLADIDRRDLCPTDQTRSAKHNQEEHLGKMRNLLEKKI